MSDQPSRLPTWAASASLSPSLRAEPVTSTASDGYGLATIPEVSEWNWMLYDIGLWARHFHERSVRTTDLFEADSTAYRVSATDLTYVVTGPLTQSAATGATYYWKGDRLVIPAGGPSQTFAPSTLNYVHLRTQSSVTSRDPETQVLVSTNATETDYVAVLSVTTDATSITLITPLSDDGPVAFAPWTFTDRVYVDQTASSAQEALRVDFPTSLVTPAVTINPKAGAARTALSIDMTGGSAGSAIATSSTGSDSSISVLHNGSGNGLRVANSGSGTGVQVSNSGSGTGVQVTNTTGSADCIAVSLVTGGSGLRVSATGGASAITLDPIAFDPTTPLEGDIWTFTGGGGSALKYHEGSKTRIVYASQDGPNAAQALVTTLLTVNAATTTSLASLSYTFRNQGIYMIRWNTLLGRQAGGTRVPTFDCRINAVTVTGGSFVADVPTSGSFISTLVNRVGHDLLYTHAGADATLTVDLRVVTDAGSAALYFDNRSVDIICVSS